jgi:hypothetical protein
MRNLDLNSPWRSTVGTTRLGREGRPGRVGEWRACDEKDIKLLSQHATLHLYTVEGLSK